MQTKTASSAIPPQMPDCAMILAAGLGVRMRPLTDSAPKPLLKVAGRSLLDRAIDRLQAAGISRMLVNSHYLAEQIHAHLDARPDVTFVPDQAAFLACADQASPEKPVIGLSHEPELLETGGGVLTALGNYPDVLGKGPFLVVNGDVAWLDGIQNAVHRLCAQWDETRMDVLMLLHPTVTAFGYTGRGDYYLTQDGMARRRLEAGLVAPFLFTGVRMMHPRIFDSLPEGIEAGTKFSILPFFDRAEEAERLWGVRHDGALFHVGTPKDLEAANAFIEDPEFSSPFF